MTCSSNSTYFTNYIFIFTICSSSLQPAELALGTYTSIGTRETFLTDFLHTAQGSQMPTPCPLHPEDRPKQKTACTLGSLGWLCFYCTPVTQSARKAFWNVRAGNLQCWLPSPTTTNKQTNQQPPRTTSSTEDNKLSCHFLWPKSLLLPLKDSRGKTGRTKRYNRLQYIAASYQIRNFSDRVQEAQGNSNDARQAHRQSSYCKTSSYYLRQHFNYTKMHNIIKGLFSCSNLLRLEFTAW